MHVHTQTVSTLPCVLTMTSLPVSSSNQLESLAKHGQATYWTYQISLKMIALASARSWQADHEECCRCFRWRPHARAIPNELADICHGSGAPKANPFQGQLYCCLAKAWVVPGHGWNHWIETSLNDMTTCAHKANVTWIWQPSGDNHLFVLLAWKPFSSLRFHRCISWGTAVCRDKRLPLYMRCGTWNASFSTWRKCWIFPQSWPNEPPNKSSPSVYSVQ